MRGNDGLNVNALVALTESLAAALRGSNRKGSGKREGGSKGKGKGEHEGDGNQTSRGAQWPCHRKCRDFHGKPLENNIGRGVCRRCGVARPKRFAPEEKSLSTTNVQRGGTTRAGPVGAGGSVPLVARRVGITFRDVLAPTELQPPPVLQKEKQPLGFTLVGKGAKPRVDPGTDGHPGGGARCGGTETGSAISAADTTDHAVTPNDPPEHIRIDDDDDHYDDDENGGNGKQELHNDDGNDEKQEEAEDEIKKAKIELDDRTEMFNKLKKAVGRKDASTEKAWKDMEAARVHHTSLKSPPPEWRQLERIDKKLQQLVEKQERRNTKWEELEKRFKEGAEKFRQEEREDLERAAELQRERKEIANSLAPEAEGPEERRAARAKLAEIEKQLEELRGMATRNEAVERKFNIVKQGMAELGAEAEKKRSAPGDDHKNQGGGKLGKEEMEVDAHKPNPAAEATPEPEGKKLRTREDKQGAAGPTLTVDQMRAKLLDKLKARILEKQQKEVAALQPRDYAAKAAEKSLEELEANTARIEALQRDIEAGAEEELREMSAEQQQALLLGCSDENL